MTEREEFEAWLAEDEKVNGCRGLSRLEIDQMRDAWMARASRRTTPHREAWISIEDRLPEEGQDVAFVVQADKGSIQDYLDGRVLGGSFMIVGGYPTFTVPGVGFRASRWMPLPTAPNGEKG